MKYLIALLIPLAILIPPSAIGADLSQWKDGDRTMISLVESGFDIVSHSHSINPNNPDRSLSIYILQRGQRVYRCTEVFNRNLKTNRRKINCQRLVSPHKK